MLSPAAAAHVASPASPPCEVPPPQGRDWEQLNGFAECLKQLKNKHAGKKINTLRKDHNYKDVPTPPCFPVQVWIGYLFGGWKKRSKGEERTKRITPQFKT